MGNVTYGVSTNLLAVLAMWFHLSMVVLPFIAYQKTFGYAHPLIIVNGYSLLNILIRKTGFFTQGISSHIALPGLGPDATQNVVSYGIFVFGLSLLCIYIGYYFGPSIKAPRLPVASKPSKLFWWVFAGTVGCSCVVMGIYVLRFGGINQVFNIMAKGASARMAMEDFSGLGQYFVPVQGACAMLLVCICWKKKIIWNPVFIGTALMVLSFPWLLTGKRSSLLFWVIQFSIGWVLRNQKLPVIRLALLGTVAFVLFGIMGLFRQSNQTGAQSTWDFLHDLSTGSLIETTMDELERRSGDESLYYAVVGRVPGDVPFRYGQTYLENIYRFIPRFIWKSKPRGIDVQANRAFVGGNWGMPVGAVGEAYWNGHIPAVIIVFFLMGMFYRWLANVVMRYPYSPAILALYIISAFSFGPGQGDFRAWIQSFVPAVILFWLCGFFRKERQRTPSASA